MDQINNQPITNVPPVSQAQQPIDDEEPKAGTRFLFYGVLLGLVVLLVVVGGVLVLNSPKKTTNYSMVPTPVPAETVTESVSASDLDSLLVGLAQADKSLDTELTTLEKDSDF